MDKNEKDPTDNETVLMALDQISQTIDVMTSVVGRLRNFLEEKDAARSDPGLELLEEMRPDRTLH